MCRNILEAKQLAGFVQPETAIRLVAAMNLQQVLKGHVVASQTLLLLPLLCTFPDSKTVEIVTMLNTLIDTVMPTAATARDLSGKLLNEIKEHPPSEGYTENMWQRIALLIQQLPNDLDLPHVDTVGDYRAIVEARSALPLVDLWFSTGFVGIVDVERCLFAWDQCILTGNDFWEEFGRILLPLLDREVMGALDSGDLYRVFSNTQDAIPWPTLLSLK